MEICDLETMPLDRLRDVWRERYGPPPKLRSADLLRRLLAFRLQADEAGGLTASSLGLLHQRHRGDPAGRELGDGALIKKVWRGRTYEVAVEADGFRFEGDRFGNLSDIATAITGTRRNGPKFFGLRHGFR
ncbi:MAG: DUF2924 domain-containing protein [Pseudomonadota bacterium]